MNIGDTLSNGNHELEIIEMYDLKHFIRSIIKSEVLRALEEVKSGVPKHKAVFDKGFPYEYAEQRIIGFNSARQQFLDLLEEVKKKYI